MIRHKLLLLFFLLATVPMVAMSTLAYVRSVNGVEQMLTEQSVVIVNDMLGRVRQTLAEPVAALGAMAQMEDLVKLAGDPGCARASAAPGDSTLGSSGTELAGPCRRGQEILGDFFLGYRHSYSRILVVSLLPAASPSAGAPVADGPAVERSDEVRAVFRTKEVVEVRGGEWAYVEPQPRERIVRAEIDRLLGRSSDHVKASELRMDASGYVHRVAVPLRTRDAVVGAIVGDLKVSTLLEETGRAQKLGRYGEPTILTADGMVLFHPDPARINLSAGLVMPEVAAAAAAVGKGAAQTRRFVRGGETWLFSAAVDDSFGWVVGLATPLGIFVRLPARAAKINVTIAVISALLGFAALLWLVALISRQVRTLTTGADAIASGNLATRIEVRSQDEVGKLAISFNAMAERLDELVRQFIEDERMREELRIGSSMQARLIPKQFPRVRGARVYGIMRPATEIGGDYFDVIGDGTGGVIIAIGDVSGKGLPAGLLMVQANAIVRSYAAMGFGPRDILLGLNRFLSERMSANLFMSLLVLSYDATHRTIHVSGAGHEHILVLSRATGTVEARRCGGTAIGILDSEHGRFSEVELALQAGDRVLLYTDGVTEARDAQGAFFGLDHLSELFVATAGLAVQESVHAMLERITLFYHETEQYDDMTMVLFEIGEDAL